MAKQKTAEDIRKEIREDAKRYLRTFAVTYCREAEKELTKTAQYAIQMFYNDYTPEVYVRTKNLLKNSYERYYKDNGKRIYGGVKISADNMFENYNYKYGGTKEAVLDAGWHGWHGLKGDSWQSDNWGEWDIKGDGGFFIHQTTPPIDIVNEKMNDKSFLNKINKKATKAANSQQYNIAKFK